MDTIRLELQPWGIHCITLEPGSSRTAFTSNMPQSFERMWKAVPEQIKQEYGTLFFFLQDHRSIGGEEWWSSRIRITTRFLRWTMSSPDGVVQAMHHAMISRYPPERYAAGWDACSIFIPLSWLPSSLANSLIHLFVKIPRPKSSLIK